MNQQIILKFINKLKKLVQEMKIQSKMMEIINILILLINKLPLIMFQQA
jgi:hypothetical protein